MYHLRFKGKHYNTGVKRGSIFNKYGIVFALNMDKYQLKRGMEDEKIIKKVY